MEAVPKLTVSEWVMKYTHYTRDCNYFGETHEYLYCPYCEAPFPRLDPIRVQRVQFWADSDTPVNCKYKYYRDKTGGIHVERH